MTEAVTAASAGHRAATGTGRRGADCEGRIGLPRGYCAAIEAGAVSEPGVGAGLATCGATAAAKKDN